MTISDFFFSFFLLTFMLCCYSPTAQLDGPSSRIANLSTTWTIQSSNEPIFPIFSQFTCGFFCERNCSSYLFVIFFYTSRYSDTRVVWSANRDHPVRKNAILNFTAAGDLVLKDEDGSIAWATNTARKSVSSMDLIYPGNLVLLDHQNSIVWQSFDHPTDSLLLGQKLYQGQKLKSSASSNNSSSQEGIYYLQVTDKGVFAYIKSNPPQAYYSRFAYSNDANKGRRKYISFLNGSLSFFIDSSEPSDYPYYVIGIPEASSTQYMKLMPDGHLKVFEAQTEGWTVVADLLTDNDSHPTANLSTMWTTNHSVVKPILRRKATGAQFTCGFYCEEDCTSYIFAIFISPITNSLGQYRTVWSANRDYPVQKDAILNFTAAGELVLKDVDGSIAWTTNNAGKSVAGMNLTDTGNLVLFDDQNSIVWQSFDYPTNSLLHGQKLFTGQKLISSVTNSLRHKDMYSLQVTNKGLFAYVESNPPQVYYSWLVNGNDTKKRRRYLRFLNGSLSFFINSSEPSDPDGVIGIPPASSTQYLKLKRNGHLKVHEWNFEVLTTSTDLTENMLDECSYPLICGRNSICSTDEQCSCPSKEYFRRVNDRKPNLGCSEITPLTCNSTKDQDFITLENVKYFTSTADMEWVSMETCKQACLNNCSCKAAFFQYFSNASSGECFLTSEIFTMRTVNPHDINALAFLKVQIVRSHHFATIIGSTIGSFTLLLVVAIGVIMYIVHKRKRDAEMEEEYLDQVSGLPNRFSYKELKTATENFSKKLGEGGYGSVFEGTLGDHTKIAVKCLKCLEGLTHIEKSFLAEVQSIGSIHHVNLVRFRGFCTWKSRRFLVYDFMSNGSLDRWIYHGVRERILEWEHRKNIILDIAKGLAYLHEECRQKIVHLDIKPQNILLDNNFNAKVSDFGLSKLIDKSKTEVMSTVKGTPGYIAPEWRSSIITEKLDVYSFGIVLLEILCGRKIFDKSQPEESWYLLVVLQKCCEQGTLLDMVDTHSEDMQVHKTEVVEMMKVASWCLQTNFKQRPSMSSVVKVLEGGMTVESNLDYTFTDLGIQEIRIQEPAVGDEKDFTRLSSSLLSGPR
ncbi:G-type lectin S-receptor-like serine/threonine-protein kinase SD2-5 [Bidens hawaiensis]|uniref:G-type lectin S-receptor-like serine/threonine-protein kinase SD2-5 n=1 Tax=Bidens hawaiensis TaxID=980011 RepID=UPI0040491BB8